MSDVYLRCFRVHQSKLPVISKAFCVVQILPQEDGTAVVAIDSNPNEDPVLYERMENYSLE